MTGAPADLNPRWLAYMHAEGFDDPELFMAREGERWPGGCMVGFILWIGERKAAFYKAHPGAFLLLQGRGRDSWTIIDFEAWDRFLGVVS